jgi:probable HAF family extracellular repeat protein
MKSRTLTWITTMTLFAALAVPLRLAAQDNQNHKNAHHHYKLIILGTLGGPQSYGDAGHGAANITNQGTVAGVADTAAPDPFFPNYNPLFSGSIGSYLYVYHVFTTTGGDLVDLGGLGGNSSVAVFMSENGNVSGSSLNGTIDSVTGWPAANAVLWKRGEISNLGTLGGYESQAGLVNSLGQVTGFATNAVPDPLSIIYWFFNGFSNGTQTRAFLWDAKNGMQDLGTLGGPDAFGIQINERGQIAGFSYTNSTPNPATGIPTTDPFLWDNGKMIDLGSLGGTIGAPNAMNNRGQVVGMSNLAGDTTSHGFLWDNGKLTDIGFPGGTFGSANALNDAGHVAGQASTADGPYHAFFWQQGRVITDLGALPGYDSTCIGAFGINSKDQVVGQAGENYCAGPGFHAFLWENGDMVDANALVPPGSGLTLGDIEKINDSGEMFGSGTLSNGEDRAFLLIPCDENHSGVEGCDYSMVEARAAASRPSPVVRKASSPALPPSLMRRMNRYRFPGGVFPVRQTELQGNPRTF